jgi:tight adherence protein C
MLDGDRRGDDEENDQLRFLKGAAMLDQVIAKLSDLHFLAVLLASIGCAATVVMAVIPLLESDVLAKRIKSVSSERERIRMRERERLQQQQNKGQLRFKTGGLAKNMAESLNLAQWLSTDTAKQKLAMAGFRGQGAEYAFLSFRFIAPIVFMILTAIYIFLIVPLHQPLFIKLGICVGAAYGGIKAPEMFLNSKTVRRQKSMNRAYPNMVDLLIICSESGMSIEHGVRKVATEIGAESVEMAEELSLLAAEMSFLEHRRIAFQNMNTRTGLDSIKQMTTVLTQSEKYGTPLGAALRVLAQESRDARMIAAEKKAASLPPALTVPMILFFLPGLFAAILGPAAIQINHWT